MNLASEHSHNLLFSRFTFKNLPQNYCCEFLCLALVHTSIQDFALHDVFFKLNNPPNIIQQIKLNLDIVEPVAIAVNQSFDLFRMFYSLLDGWKAYLFFLLWNFLAFCWALLNCRSMSPAMSSIFVLA